MTKPIRVFLVDDHALFLSGVRTELEDGFDIVGQASDVDDAIDAILDTKPDVILIDVHMPGGGGLAVINRVTGAVPELRFLALSVSDAAEDVIAMIRAGARGYVTKSIAPGELGEAVRRVSDGDAVFSPRLAGFVLDAFGDQPIEPLDPELDQLTNRAREVMRLIARGFAYTHVARKLDISLKTVEPHLSSVLRKLPLSNRHHLPRCASDPRPI